MPEIDVTDVLLDSEIAGEAFIVERRTETVGQNGQSTVAIAQIQAYGAIQPEGDNDLIRTEDYDVQSKSVVVITNFRLRGVSQDAQGKEYKPDIVIWKGNSFIVKTVEDFSQYGGGMIEALCTSEDFVDQAPV